MAKNFTKAFLLRAIGAFAEHGRPILSARINNDGSIDLLTEALAQVRPMNDEGDWVTLAGET